MPIYNKPICRKTSSAHNAWPMRNTQIIVFAYIEPTQKIQSPDHPLIDYTDGHISYRISICRIYCGEECVLFWTGLRTGYAIPRHERPLRKDHSLSDGVLGCPLADLCDVRPRVSLRSLRQHLQAHVVSHRGLHETSVRCIKLGGVGGERERGRDAACAVCCLSSTPHQV